MLWLAIPILDADGMTMDYFGLRIVQSMSVWQKKNQNLSLHNIVGIIVGPEALAVTATAPRLRGRWDVTIRAQKQKFLR